MRSPYRETDPRTLSVLSAALRSPSRSTRLRAVAMLAMVECPQRALWLECALADRDSAVRQTALIVMAWIGVATRETETAREWGDGRGEQIETLDQAEATLPSGCPCEWEYTVEVWRIDGLLLGVFYVTTCAEDDAHARALALGHAILANHGGRGDRFDPEEAATFVVEKAQRPRRATRG
jgi:hypothetical protein